MNFENKCLHLVKNCLILAKQMPKFDLKMAKYCENSLKDLPTLSKKCFEMGNSWEQTQSYVGVVYESLQRQNYLKSGKWA